MKNRPTTNEILLVTGTTFSGRKLCRVTEKKQLSEKQRLERACWDGLLTEMLPEVVREHTTRNPQFIWQVKPIDQLLVVKIGTSNEDIPVSSSINPYYYLLTSCRN